MFKKKEKKVRGKFTEIWIDINNFENKSFKRIKLPNVSDSVLVYNGNKYVIDKSAITRTKYDPLQESLKGISKLFRFFKGKKIGFLNYRLPIETKTGNLLTDQTILPYTREDNIPDERTEKIGNSVVTYDPLTPPLLKALVNSAKFAKFIHSLPQKKGVGLGNKWIIIVAILGLIIAGVVIVIGMGFVKIPGVN